MQVQILVSTQHGDHWVSQKGMNAEEAAKWLKKIDAAMGNSTLDTIETDWGTFYKNVVLGARILSS
jgi:hypothetical protein